MSLENRFRVNWVDGMKINKKHFMGLEDSVLQAINNAERKYITPLNYGLLSNFSKQENAINVQVSIDAQNTIVVELNKCLAITLGGYQIHITEETKPLLEKSGVILKHDYEITSEENEFYIVVTVNPHKRVPIGNANPSEDPPRQPYVLPEYKIDVIAKNDVTNKEIGLHHITIGKVQVKDGKASIVEDYIPPCSSIQSHPELRFTYSEIVKFLNHMESYSMHIIQKIYQKKQQNDLSEMVLYLSKRVIEYSNNNLPEFRLHDKYESPYIIVSKLVGLARTIKNSLDVYAGTGKEELLNYLTDWCDLNQGAFENVIIDMIEIKYDHKDINLALHKVSSFTKLMLSLFKKLNELEYIGKKADSTIFVTEEIVDKTETSNNRRSFLLD